MLVGFLVLAGCGRQGDLLRLTTPDTKMKIVVDSELRPYVLEFQDTFDVEAKSSALFAELEAPRVGVCTVYRNVASGNIAGREVRIDPDFWENAPEIRKRGVMFHELGHCRLGRDHIDETFDDGCPTTFMHYTLASEQCYDEHWDEYIEEMR